MKTLIAIPCVNTLPIDFVTSLLKIVNSDTTTLFIQNSLIYDARNQAVDIAINNGFDYLLFLDSDMIVNENTLLMLMRNRENIISGLYVERRGEHRITAYDNVKTRAIFRSPNADNITLDSDTCLREVEGIGMGCCLIKVECLKQIRKKYKSLFEPYKGLGEDLSFCYRARKCGYHIMLDTTVRCGHIGEQIYEYGGAEW